MRWMMPLMSTYFAFTFPAAIGIYWVFRSIASVGQQFILSKMYPAPKYSEDDMKKAVSEVKAGRVEYRTDSFGNIHGIIGKASFDDEKLVQNLNTFVGAIIKVKPTTVKGKYINNISISSTMGPGIKLDLNSFDF